MIVWYFAACLRNAEVEAEIYITYTEFVLFDICKALKNIAQLKY